jgi:glutathione S-transferase
MKLYYTPNSPYARICRMTAELAGLTDEIELDWVKLRTADNPVIALSPLGRVPLLTDGDLVLSEARLICTYLDDKGGKARTVAAPDDWQALSSEAEMLAFLDTMTVWSREVRREEGTKSDFLLEIADDQLRRELAHLDGTLKAPNGEPPLNFGTMSLLTALGMMRFYKLVPDWRETYPTVAAWSDAYDALPIVASTAPSADALRPLTR